MHRRRTRLLVAAVAIGLPTTGCMERSATPADLGTRGTGPSAAATTPGGNHSPGTGSPTLDALDVGPGATPAPTRTAPSSPSAPSAPATPPPGDGWQEPPDPPPAEFLAVEELPPELGLEDATVQENPTEDADGKTWSLVDLYAYPAAAGCADEDGQQPWPSPIGWHSRLASSEAALFADTTGAEGEPPALALLQGLSTPDDAAAVLTARGAQVSTCPPPGTLPLFDDAPSVVRLATPDVGDEAVAWRQLVIYPEAFVMVHDTVWWRRGEHLGAVLVVWVPGSIPGAGGPGEAPEEPIETESFDPAAWLANAGEERMVAGLEAAAAELDARLAG